MKIESKVAGFRFRCCGCFCPDGGQGAVAVLGMHGQPVGPGWVYLRGIVRQRLVAMSADWHSR